MQKYSILLLRLGLGSTLIMAGLLKFTTEGWSTDQFLTSATNGPFAELFQSLVGVAVVTPLVVYGELLMGAALILGLAMRFTGLVVSLYFALLWLALLQRTVVDEHLIYVFLGLLFYSAKDHLFNLDDKLAFLKKKHKVFKSIMS